MVLPLFASMPNAASSAVRPSIVRSSAVLPETESGDQPVDLNQATELELSGIPGVGPRTAKKIVAWREEHGPYRNADDLLQIDGIGNRRYLTMAPFITIGKTKAP
jgi:competence protein ComEA